MSEKGGLKSWMRPEILKPIVECTRHDESSGPREFAQPSNGPLHRHRARQTMKHAIRDNYVE